MQALPESVETYLNIALRAEAGVDVQEDEVKALPSWVRSSIRRALADPVTGALAGLAVGGPLGPHLSRFGLDGTRNTEALLRKVFEAAMSVRALGLEIASLGGQWHTLHAELHSSQVAHAMAIRAQKDGEDSLKAVGRLATNVFPNTKQAYIDLATWASNAEPMPHDNFYSQDNIEAVSNEAGLMTEDAGGNHARGKAASKRQEDRHQHDLKASGRQWKVAGLLDTEAAAANADSSSRLTEYAAPTQTDKPTWAHDVHQRETEAEARKAAVGPKGHDVERRLNDAWFRYVSERVALKLYIAAFVDSVRRVPAYSAHYDSLLLQRLEELTDSFALLGSGADRVFECLAWIDLISKQLSLHAKREERSVVVVVSERRDAAPLYQGTTTFAPVATDPFRLLRYIKIASLSAVTLTDVQLTRGATSAWIGSALPIEAAGPGAELAVEHFWNEDLPGEWEITAAGMSPADEINHVHLLVTFGYEVIPANTAQASGAALS